MVEYETFAYLALQKTGSTFIVEFLRRFCGEKLIYLEKHKPVPAERHRREKLYVISVRNPLDQYISLYSFGVEKKGDALSPDAKTWTSPLSTMALPMASGVG